jgi:hypothetical protein
MPNIELADLKADSSRLATALSKLFIHVAGMVVPIAVRTDDPGWRAVALELDQLVARLRVMAGEAGDGAPKAEDRGRSKAHASWLLLRQARKWRPPQA